jgi:hypothetical protein
LLFSTWSVIKDWLVAYLSIAKSRWAVRYSESSHEAINLCRANAELAPVAVATIAVAWNLAGEEGTIGTSCAAASIV